MAEQPNEDAIAGSRSRTKSRSRTENDSAYEAVCTKKIENAKERKRFRTIRGKVWNVRECFRLSHPGKFISYFANGMNRTREGVIRQRNLGHKFEFVPMSSSDEDYSSEPDISGEPCLLCGEWYCREH
jgi:hypothetical protein